MNPRSALGAAAAVALTVTGGVSAMFLTIGQANAAPDNQPAPAADYTAVEYVDQYGNPVDAPTAMSSTPEIIYMNPDGSLATNPAAAQPQVMAEPQMAYGEEYEAEEYEGEEYEDGEESEEEYEESEEHEEEYEEADGYEAAGAYPAEGGEHG
ncbi:MAG: hypothetical protein ACRBK7_27125 [Acidimicrobiales bacterium]